MLRFRNTSEETWYLDYRGLIFSEKPACQHHSVRMLVCESIFSVGEGEDSVNAEDEGHIYFRCIHPEDLHFTTLRNCLRVSAFGAIGPLRFFSEVFYWLKFVRSLSQSV